MKHAADYNLGKTVYFGELGKNAGTLIDYFQNNGGRRIEQKENVAEYMLDVIGAGATASSEIEWHQKWVESKEAKVVQDELEKIHAEGRQKPAVKGKLTFPMIPLQCLTISLMQRLFAVRSLRHGSIKLGRWHNAMPSFTGATQHISCPRLL
jgi:hypothetical protein